MLAAAMLLVASPVRADADSDYEAGLNSYKAGDVYGAMPPLRKAVEAGHVKAMVVLASILDYSEFDQEAIELYRKAAEQGDAEGMLGLGTMISIGDGVEKQDMVEARRWIEKAAELNHPLAVRVMASAYLKGELGLAEADRDTPRGLHWVQLAAKDDFLPAVDALADAYRTGAMLGLAADPELAEQHLARSNKLRGLEPEKGKKKKRK